MTSNLSAFAFIPERAEATPALWNNIFSTLSANIAAADSSASLTAPSGNTVSISTNLEVIGGAHFQFLSVGSTPPSYVTTAAVTIEVNSAFSDYLYMVDSSAQKSSYVIGSRAGGTADGLNIWDASAGTMIVSFSKQSIRFFHNVVGPVFDTGGALADTYNAATFIGSGSSLSAIQAAINQASIDHVARVYLPASMYPYSASSISFIYTIQMVREGGNWGVLDVRAYGAYGNNSNIDTAALQAAFAASEKLSTAVYLPGGTYLSGLVQIGDPLTASELVNAPASRRIYGDGLGSVIRAKSGTTTLLVRHNSAYVILEDFLIDGADIATIGLDMDWTAFAGPSQANRYRNLIIQNCTNEAFSALNNNDSELDGIVIRNLSSGVTGLDVRGSGGHMIISNSYVYAGTTHIGGQNCGAVNSGFLDGVIVESGSGQNYCGFHGCHFFNDRSTNLVINTGGTEDCDSLTFSSCYFVANSASSILSGRYRELVNLLGCRFTGTGNMFGTISSVGGTGNPPLFNFVGGASTGLTWNTPSVTTAKVRRDWFWVDGFPNNLRNFDETVDGNFVANKVLVPTGTALAPTLAFSSENSLGLYRSGVSTMGLSYGQLLLPSGTAIQPARAFSSESSLGWYRSTTSVMALSYGTLQLSGLTVTGPCLIQSAANPALQLQSGNNNSLAAFSMGRTSDEFDLAVAAFSGQFFSNVLVAGDVAIRAPNSAQTLHLGASSLTPSLSISAGSVILNQSRLVSIRTLAASSVTASAAKTNVARDEVVFTIGGASGASLCIMSGGTLYYFNSFASVPAA